MLGEKAVDNYDIFILGASLLVIKTGKFATGRDIKGLDYINLGVEWKMSWRSSTRSQRTHLQMRYLQAEKNQE